MYDLNKGGTITKDEFKDILQVSQPMLTVYPMLKKRVNVLIELLVDSL